MQLSQQERITKVKQTLRFMEDYPKKGVNFCDIMPVLYNPEALHFLIDTFEHTLKAIEFDVIVGLESRGFLLGAPLAYKLKKPFIPIRKKGKLPGECHTIHYDLEYGKDCVELQKNAIHPGQKVLLLDDILATGGTMGAAIQLVNEAKGDIAACLFLAQVNGLGGKSKLKVDAEKILIMMTI